ncbi:MAG TPA: YdcF family protein [Terracidiphilus sp.]|jgi:uncharacterized SAM-binding protein YcdF (DUF218 family)
MSWRTRAVLLAILAGFGLCAWAYLARRLAPRGNTRQTEFDAIVVLGNPADADGNPTPTELSRVTEAVRAYERGEAAHLIFSGAAVKNQYLEARIMARTAEAQGIPAPAVVVEPEARDTIENACYSVRLMQAHGWKSAEVVTSAWHAQRAGLIFSRMPIAWRVLPAPPLEPETAWYRHTMALEEMLKTVRYLVWARPMERCEP